MKKIIPYFLLLIIILGFVLRFYNLSSIPSGFHRDEAFLGYNGYSLLKTGKDISGAFMPLHLESFIYTPAGYSYLTIPSIAIFDLNIFSVRFPSAFFGVLTLIVTFFLTRKLFNINLANGNAKADTKPKIINNNFHSNNTANNIAIIATFLLAITPWHINLSRTASVITVVVFLVSLGVLFYLYWLENSKMFLLVLSMLSFGFCLMFYVAPYSFVPLFIPMMFFVLKKNKINPKQKIISLLLFLVLIIVPLLLTITSKDLSLRARSISLTGDLGIRLILDEKIREDGVSNASLLQTRLFHNKVIGITTAFLQNYFKHFSYEFLFTDQGYPTRYRVPLIGLLYICEIPLLILGLWYLLHKGRIGYFIILWVLLAPIGSSLTSDDVPNLQRTLFIFPALSIISASGLYYGFTLINKGGYIYKPLIILFIFAMCYNTFFLYT